MKKLLILLSMTFATFAHADTGSALQIAKQFHAYCYGTFGNYEKINSLAEIQGLKELDAKLVQALSGPDSKGGKGFVIYRNEKTEYTLAVAFGKPNACSVMALEPSTSIDQLKKFLISQFKLKLAFTDDVGLQVNEMYIPDGIYGTVKEAHKKGIIAVMYPKPAAGGKFYTISYLPPESAKKFL